MFYLTFSLVPSLTRKYTCKGERAHRLVKKFYGDSNKKAVEKEIVRQERRQTLLRRQLDLDNVELEIEGIDPSPQLHHSMASTPRRDNTFNLLQLLQDHRNDPAVKVGGVFFQAEQFSLMKIMVWPSAEFHAGP